MDIIKKMRGIEPGKVEVSIIEAFVEGDLKINNGVVTLKGKKVGTVMQRLQHGYHPSIEVKVGEKTEWLEMDTPDLQKKAIDLVKKFVGQMGEAVVNENMINALEGARKLQQLIQNNGWEEALTLVDEVRANIQMMVDHFAQREKPISPAPGPAQEAVVTEKVYTVIVKRYELGTVEANTPEEAKEKYEAGELDVDNTMSGPIPVEDVDIVELTPEPECDMDGGEYHRPGRPIEGKVAEGDTKNIKAKNPGLLKVPGGKRFYDMPISHYVGLAKEKGRAAIMRGLLNIWRWNKNKAPDLAKRAKDFIDRVKANPQWKALATVKEELELNQEMRDFGYEADDSETLLENVAMVDKMAHLFVNKHREERIEKVKEMAKKMAESMNDEFRGSVFVKAVDEMLATITAKV